MAQINLDINSKFNSKGFADATRGLADMSKQAGKTGQTIGAISGALGGASGEMGKLGGAASATGGILASLSSGPLAIFTTIVASGVALVKSWHDEKVKLNAELKKSAENLKTLNAQHEKNLELIEADTAAEKAEIQQKQSLEDLEKKLQEQKKKTLDLQHQEIEAAADARKFWEVNGSRRLDTVRKQLKESMALEVSIADQIAQAKKDIEIKQEEDGAKRSNEVRKKAYDEYLAYIKAKYADYLDERDMLSLKRGGTPWAVESGGDSFKEGTDYASLLAGLKDEMARQTATANAEAERRKQADEEAKAMREKYLEYAEAAGLELSNIDRLGIARGEKDEDIQQFIRDNMGDAADWEKLLARTKDTSDAAKALKDRNAQMVANQVADLDRISDEIDSSLAAKDSSIKAIDANMKGMQAQQAQQLKEWAAAKAEAEKQGKNLDKLRFLEDGVTPADEKTAAILERYSKRLQHDANSATAITNLQKMNEERWRKIQADGKAGKMLTENQLNVYNNAKKWYSFRDREQFIRRDEETKAKLQAEKDKLARDKENNLNLIKIVKRLGAQNS